MSFTLDPTETDTCQCLEAHCKISKQFKKKSTVAHIVYIGGPGFVVPRQLGRRGVKAGKCEENLCYIHFDEDDDQRKGVIRRGDIYVEQQYQRSVIISMSSGISL